ncbi:YoaK family protein [Kaistia dalseonensis]|uniref:Uncharacterized membrane protein YoaK (UPF0700 family) n=1 Tax=Kaistia dalseonensis TaxID=410840 RepID=A0ABU0HDM5_9HYPH|nr:YoaK family protein [Kaistia dalseonensis]MCX5497777.1 YoaK family protein [Kaistia dalseonensis]MDQ0440421.1 uncharacterized membrane protein YoaK (UPF0700 family) [Kaistia dalseonensis]
MLEHEAHRPGRHLSQSYRHTARRIVAPERNGIADTQLGLVLTFVAGAVNAGGFLIVGQYTSHMSGIVSAMADHIALGLFSLVVGGLSAFLAFLTGAACSAILINWGRRHYGSTQYVLPITLECVLLLSFGAIAALALPSHVIEWIAIPLLCFIMGLQNATVTKISGARMRTTHVTGIVTDIGIELGKFAYECVSHREADGTRVVADRAKLGLLASLLTAFVTGGVVGAFGFSTVGPFFACLLALILAALVAPSITEIVQHGQFLRRSSH